MRVAQSSSNSLAPVISMSRATMLDVADTRRFAARLSGSVAGGQQNPKTR